MTVCVIIFNYFVLQVYDKMSDPPSLREKCFYFNTLGHCKWGEFCRYEHDDDLRNEILDNCPHDLLTLESRRNIDCCIGSRRRNMDFCETCNRMLRIKKSITPSG